MSAASHSEDIPHHRPLSSSCSGRPLTFSTAPDRRTADVTTIELSFNGFVERLKRPTRGKESLTEYLALRKERQDDLKDVGYYVPGKFQHDRRKGENLICRDAVVLDLDHAPTDVIELAKDALSGWGEFTWVAHPTRKHRPDAPRWRFIFPLSRSCSPAEWCAVSRMLADWVTLPGLKRAIDWCDPASFSVAQMMYWPSTCSDSAYEVIENAGDKWASPDSILKRLGSAWCDESKWPRCNSERELSKHAAKQAGRPHEKPGVIGAFCRSYDILDAIEKFLPGLYLPGTTPNRLTYSKGTTSNGARLYEAGVHLWSDHESDPAHGKCCNAFDLVRIHRFHHLDDHIDQSLPINKRPSHKAMLALVSQLPEVQTEMTVAETPKLGNVPADVQAEIEAAQDDALFLPNDHLPAPVAAGRIFSRLGSTRELFRRGEAVIELTRDHAVQVVTPTMLRSRLNLRGRKTKAFTLTDSGQRVAKPKQASEDTAKLLLSCREIGLLPEINLVAAAPVLIEEEDAICSTVPGYNERGGVLVVGSHSVHQVGYQQALTELARLVTDFRFVSGGDKARALVSLVAPALRMGGLVRGRATALCIEANESQTGKGYLLDIIHAIYNETPTLVARREGGVGSLDESIGQAVLRGRPFIQIDNFRGQLRSEWFEAALTADSTPVPIRVPYKGEVQVDASRVSFSLTSNGMEGTTDLANRLLVVRLLKQDLGYLFAKFPEGDVVQHVRARQAFYLGCVHSLIRCWHDSGKPRNDTEHSFRVWIGVLDWFSREVFETGPLLDGHAEAIGRIASPGLSWLRQMAYAVERAGRLGVELRAHDLWTLAQEHDVGVPGLTLTADDSVAARRIGVVLGGCFRERADINLGGITVRRIEVTYRDFDERKERTGKAYRFERSDA